MAQEKFLTPREYALCKGLTLNTVYQSLWVGRIKGAVQGSKRRWRIPVSESVASETTSAQTPPWDLEQKEESFSSNPVFKREEE